MAKLTEQEQNVHDLRTVEKLSYNQIAARLDITKNSVVSASRRALRKLAAPAEEPKALELKKAQEPIRRDYGPVTLCSSGEEMTAEEFHDRYPAGEIIHIILIDGPP